MRATTRLPYKRPLVVRMWSLCQNWYLRYLLT